MRLDMTDSLEMRLDETDSLEMRLDETNSLEMRPDMTESRNEVRRDRSLEMRLDVMW